MKRTILLLCFLFSFHISLYAGTTSVTNTGNVPVRVEYKGDKGDYQEAHLKPGESKELPGGIEKVKLSRENKGEWAKGTKPGEDIKVDVKDGDKNVGTLKGYGDKLIFDHSTTAPLQTSVQINSPIPVPVPTKPADKPINKPTTSPQGQVQLNDNDVKIATDTKPAEQKQESQKTDQPPGTIQNTSQLAIQVTYKDMDGKEIKTSVIQGGRTEKIPDGTDSVGLSENMIQSGILWPDLARDPQVTIHHQDGKIETVKDIPPGYQRQPKYVEIKHTDYFKGAKFQTNPYRDSMKLDYKLGSYKYNSDSNQDSKPEQPSGRDMDSNSNDLRTQVRYQF